MSNHKVSNNVYLEKINMYDCDMGHNCWETLLILWGSEN